MILKKGDMWDRFGKVERFLFTSNPIVNKQGLAVMGRGIAKQMADRYPEIRDDFARQLQGWQAVNLRHPNVLEINEYGGQMVGYFMVKDHWRSPASLSIIEESVNEVIAWDTDPWFTIALNFPGIGNGKLRREDVLPIIERLPDNVEVWEYE